MFSTEYPASNGIYFSKDSARYVNTLGAPRFTYVAAP